MSWKYVSLQLDLGQFEVYRLHIRNLVAKNGLGIAFQQKGMKLHTHSRRIILK